MPPAQAEFPAGFLEVIPSSQHLTAGESCDIAVRVECAERYRRHYEGAQQMEGDGRAIHCQVIPTVQSYYHVAFDQVLEQRITNRQPRCGNRTLYVVEANAGANARVSYVVAVGGRRHGQSANGGSWAQLEVAVIDNATGQERGRLAGFRVETSVSQGTGQRGTTVLDGDNTPEVRLMRTKADEAIRLLVRIAGEGQQPRERRFLPARSAHRLDPEFGEREPTPSEPLARWALQLPAALEQPRRRWRHPQHRDGRGVGHCLPGIAAGLQLPDPPDARAGRLSGVAA